MIRVLLRSLAILIFTERNGIYIIDLQTPPEVVGGIKAKYLRGVAKVGEERLLVMLNLSEVLNKSEIIQLEGLEE